MSISFKTNERGLCNIRRMNSTTSLTLTAPFPVTASPSGPTSRWWGWPLLRAMRADYLGFTSALHREHGDITFMRLFNERAYDLFTPELVREALVDHADSVIRWERGIEVFAQVFGQSVLVTEGAVWQRQRRMLQAAFTPRKVAGYADLMVGAATQALDSALPAAPSRAAQRVDMDALFSTLTMDVILRTLFGARADGDTAAASAAVQTLSATAMDEMFQPFTWPDWLPLPGKAAKRRALNCLRGLVGSRIAAHKAQAEGQPGNDLLSMLLALRDDTTGSALSDAEVFDQCMVSFQAGHETSATALLWWSRLMAEHPQVAARAQAEVDARLEGRAPQAADAAALPWLTATLKEAMRLYPPVAAVMTRRTTQTITLGGHAVAKGALLRITPWVNQRDPRWFDAPDEFRPERFLPDAPPPPRGAWMPFGTGPRVCLGQHFAMLEMTLVAALLLQRCTLALPADAPPADPVLNVTLRPRHGLHLMLSPRADVVAASGGAYCGATVGLTGPSDSGSETGTGSGAGASTTGVAGVGVGVGTAVAVAGVVAVVVV
jgi:cytochrome P450